MIANELRIGNIVNMQNLAEHPLGVMPLKTIPIKALQQFLDTPFKFWLSNLINVSSDKEGALDEAMNGIKEHCWGMNLLEIKKMLELYVDGKLHMEPRSNYFDRIVLVKIVDNYKKLYSKPVEKHKELPVSTEDKEFIAYVNCIMSFDDYKQNSIMSKYDWTVYDHLDEKGIINYSEKERKETFNIMRENFPHKSRENCIKSSKKILLKRFYDQLITKNKHIKQLLKQ